MDALLAQLADIGGPAFLLLLTFRFFPQFERMLELAREYAGEASDRVEIFSARTIVILTRPIWWVILPILLVASIMSTVTHWFGTGEHWAWFTTSLILKLMALIWAGITAWRVYRVRHVDLDDPWVTAPARTQEEIYGRYGRPWLFVPMIVTAFWSLAIVTSALLIDTFALADEVMFYHSMFMATQFVLALVFTLGFAFVVGAALHAVSAIGIDVGGGVWNTFARPFITIVTPLITAANNAQLQVTPEARERLKASIHGLLVDNRFAGGLIAAWTLWFMSFHGPLAWAIELAIIIVLVAILFTYVWIIRKNILRVAEWIVIAVCTLGGVMFALRLIDAAFPGPQPVMFYERVGSLFVGDHGNGLGCYVAGVSDVSLVIVGVIALVIGWLATRTSGKRSATLLLVAALVGLPVVGIVAAQQMAPAGYLCAPRGSELAGLHKNSVEHPDRRSGAVEATPPNDPFERTQIAGTYSPPSPSCSTEIGTGQPVCPGAAPH